ncbi:hypothetical protein J7369_11235 [Xanthomonas phaseoli pv. dieffenbachiae]|uniref:hypothetical protein n=1 Tax=Xanthomonas TaxID=338 RepID=UPI001ADD325F|nr:MULTISPECIES: hypothetical protein [Xanthomonas]MBO9898270.1 hypothetical protein [Xanthomonas phaseoli pv. dieffenbachiae]MCC8613714.1 hypothetical protein [Xanthomonas euvesicatoria pv. euvesicatoria]
MSHPLAQIHQQAAQYGYGVSADGTIYRIDRPERRVRAVVRQEGSRVLIQLASSGAALWCGSEIGEFLTSFMRASRIEPQASGSA